MAGLVLDSSIAISWALPLATLDAELRAAARALGMMPSRPNGASARASHRDESCHLPAVAGKDHDLTALDLIQQLREVRFGLEGADLNHHGSNWSARSWIARRPDASSEGLAAQWSAG
jgi:hypothetical protein